MKREGCPCPWLSRCRLWRVASKAGSCRSDLKGATTEDGVTNPSSLSWGSGQYPTTANVKTNENRNADTQQLSVQCTRFAWLSVTRGETLSMDVTMHPSCQLEWFQSSLTLFMFPHKLDFSISLVLLITSPSTLLSTISMIIRSHSSSTTSAGSSVSSPRQPSTFNKRWGWGRNLNGGNPKV